MKKVIFLGVIMFMVLAGISQVSAASMAERLKGKILLQVEENGEAWYVNPADSYRYYLGRPADAFQIMRELGLGISEVNYNKFNGYAPKNLSGKILLRVEANGEAYYVNPTDLKMHYLGRPADAFRIMRELGLGITNGNLNQIIAKETSWGGFGATIHLDISDDSNTATVETETSEVTMTQFETNFLSCTPSSTVYELGGMNLAYSYEIIGLESGKCKMKTKYTKNPNPDWVEKDMTCLYDNSKTLTDSALEITDQLWVQKKKGTCIGELAEIMVAE